MIAIWVRTSFFALILLHFGVGTKLDFVANNNRTAICMSGQLRSHNISFHSGKIHIEKNYAHLENSSQTVASTIINEVFSVLDHTGFDVFMYLEAPMNSTLVGPLKTEPDSPDDYSGCTTLSSSKYFDEHHNNKFFCRVSEELSLANLWLSKLPSLGSYAMPGYQSGLLTQLYGMKQCNEAIMQYETQMGYKFKFKMRLRPDIASTRSWTKNITEIDFTMDNKDNHFLSNEINRFKGKPELIKAHNCTRKIRFASWDGYAGGNEDWFNVGLADDMDVLLNRYTDLTTHPRGNEETDFFYPPGPLKWSAEHYIVNVAREKGICLEHEPSIHMAPVRVLNHKRNVHKLRDPVTWVQQFAPA